MHVLSRTKRLFCFGSLVILDVVCRYLSLFLLYINIKIGKNRCLMLDYRWPSVWEIAVHLAVLVMSLMASFYAVLFPTRCLG